MGLPQSLRETNSSALCKIVASVFHTVMRWRKLREMENKCVLHNSIVFAIFVLKLSKSVEIWHGYDKTTLTVFFSETRVVLCLSSHSLATFKKKNTRFFSNSNRMPINCLCALIEQRHSVIFYVVAFAAAAKNKANAHWTSAGWVLFLINSCRFFLNSFIHNRNGACWLHCSLNCQ